MNSPLLSAEAPEDDRLPPHAQPNLPFLGNALHYKRHPATYLVQQGQKLGGVFRLNLAGDISF